MTFESIFNSELHNLVTAGIAYAAVIAAWVPSKVQKINGITTSIFGLVNMIGQNFLSAKNKD